MIGPEGRQQLRQASKVTTLGIEMGLALVLCLFAGRWLDARFDTAPLFLLFGLFLGFATGFKRFWEMFLRYRPRPSPDGAKGPDPRAPSHPAPRPHSRSRWAGREPNPGTRD